MLSEAGDCRTAGHAETFTPRAPTCRYLKLVASLATRTARTACGRTFCCTAKSQSCNRFDPAVCNSRIKTIISWSNCRIKPQAILTQRSGELQIVSEYSAALSSSLWLSIVTHSASFRRGRTAPSQPAFKLSGEPFHDAILNLLWRNCGPCSTVGQGVVPGESGRVSFVEWGASRIVVSRLDGRNIGPTLKIGCCGRCK